MMTKILELAWVTLLALSFGISVNSPHVTDQQSDIKQLQISNKKPPPRGSGRREWMIR